MDVLWRSSVMYGGSALCDAVIPPPCGAPCAADGAAYVVRLSDVALGFGAKIFCIASGDSAHAIVRENNCDPLRHTVADKPAEINVQGVPMLCLFK